MEIYRVIKGYKERYLVSNLGNVISCKNGNSKQLSKLNSKQGYLFVRLSFKNTAKTKLIHRLVAEVFIDNSDGLPQVDHIDGNKKNNNVLNLQWMSCKDNTTKSQGVKIIQHCLLSGIKTEWKSISEAAKVLNLNKSNIHKCCSGKKPTMYKSKWSYVSENIRYKQNKKPK